jgi:GT2 family glycosyltransferase
MTAPLPDVVISIVNHSNPEMLAECLRSIHINTRCVSFEVWVVDNATDGRGVADIRSEFPDTRWILNDRRQGFAANHNQVLIRACGRHFCILNDDTVVLPGGLDELVDFLDAHPDVGMAGPRTLNRDGTFQASTFRFIPLVRLKRWSLDPAYGQDRPQPVDWLLGACLVIRRAALNQVGPLDDRLAPIGNMEDVDWCRRVRNAGWGMWFVPAARITHYGGQSYWMDRSGVDGMRVEMMRANLRYFRKHSGWLAAAFVALIYLLVLPWNLLMLSQMAVRGRFQWSLALAQMGTSVAIARTGIGYLAGSDQYRLGPPPSPASR